MGDFRPRILLIIALLFLVVPSVFFIYQEKKILNIYYSKYKNNIETTANFKIGEDVESLQEKHSSEQVGVRNRGCVGEGPVVFTHPPIKIGDIRFIDPMGLMIDGHVTPIDHQYYYSVTWSPELKEENLKDVYAPAKGAVTTIQSMPEYFNRAKNTNLGDYFLIIHHTCTFYTIYIHLNKLTPKLKKALQGNSDEPVWVKAGEIIGKANALDFSAHNDEVTLKGFIIPEHYEVEPWKVHTVDPFDYFSPEVKNVLLTKNRRKFEPYGGKIDYDIDGKLIGNWFKENTGGYRGIYSPEYWKTHVSFSPDARDPAHFIISLGSYEGYARQFGAKKNQPKPDSVDTSSGIVRYELVNFRYVNSRGEPIDISQAVFDLKAKNDDFVEGVVLVQLVESGKLKLEIFPEKKSEEINGFTDNAMIYER
jgi:hypothetical protein